MRIFVDTNVLLDMVLNREESESATRVFSLCDLLSNVRLSVSILTMANVAYVARHKMHGEALYNCLERINAFIDVESMDSETLKKAISIRAKDFEDALQYVCAKDSGCEFIVTRNKKDFNFSKIRVVSPDELIEELHIV